jgi:hypothetical protein
MTAPEQVIWPVTLFDNLGEINDYGKGLLQSTATGIGFNYDSGRMVGLPEN